VYIKALGMFIFTSWNKFMGMPMEALHDSSIIRTDYRGIGYMRRKQLQRTYIRVHLHQWVQILNHHLEMGHTAPGYTVRFTT
jgi:hypothetical protein